MKRLSETETSISAVPLAPTAAASVIVELQFQTDSSLIFRVVLPAENLICIN